VKLFLEDLTRIIMSVSGWVGIALIQRKEENNEADPKGFFKNL
jgi:hypothetical protein